MSTAPTQTDKRLNNSTGPLGPPTHKQKWKPATPPRPCSRRAQQRQKSEASPATP
nr:MAG TPA: hypothetical protein [Caudoviricetes sp.]